MEICLCRKRATALLCSPLAKLIPNFEHSQPSGLPGNHHRAKILLKVPQNAIYFLALSLSLPSVNHMEPFVPSFIQTLQQRGWLWLLQQLHFHHICHPNYLLKKSNWCQVPAKLKNRTQTSKYLISEWSQLSIARKKDPKTNFSDSSWSFLRKWWDFSNLLEFQGEAVTVEWNIGFLALSYFLRRSRRGQSSACATAPVVSAQVTPQGSDTISEVDSRTKGCPTLWALSWHGHGTFLSPWPSPQSSHPSNPKERPSKGDEGTGCPCSGHQLKFFPLWMLQQGPVGYFGVGGLRGSTLQHHFASQGLFQSKIPPKPSPKPRCCVLSSFCQGGD